MFGLFAHRSVATWAPSTFWRLCGMLLGAWACKCLFGNPAFISSGCTPRWRMVGSCGYRRFLKVWFWIWRNLESIVYLFPRKIIPRVCVFFGSVQTTVRCCDFQALIASRTENSTSGPTCHPRLPPDFKVAPAGVGGMLYLQDISKGKSWPGAGRERVRFSPNPSCTRLGWALAVNPRAVL